MRTVLFLALGRILTSFDTSPFARQVPCEAQEFGGVHVTKEADVSLGSRKDVSEVLEHWDLSARLRRPGQGAGRCVSVPVASFVFISWSARTRRARLVWWRPRTVTLLCDARVACCARPRSMGTKSEVLSEYLADLNRRRLAAKAAAKAGRGLPQDDGWEDDARRFIGLVVSLPAVAFLADAIMKRKRCCTSWSFALSVSNTAFN